MIQHSRQERRVAVARGLFRLYEVIEGRDGKFFIRASRAGGQAACLPHKIFSTLVDAMHWVDAEEIKEQEAAKRRSEEAIRL